MNITMFIAHMALGGAQRVCINLANEFIKQGHQVTILVLDLKRDHDVNTHLLDPACKIESLGVARIRYAIFPMLRYLRKKKPEFILVFGNEMAVILNKLRKCHLIDTRIIVRVLNNLNIRLSKDDNISPLVENYLRKAQKNLKDMDHLISQCEEMEKMLVDGKMAEPDKVTTIYNPVSDFLIQSVKRKNPKKEEKQIVFIGRVDPQKNLSHLICAFAKVAEKSPNTRLRIIGDGNSKESVAELIHQLNIADKVTLEGITSHIEKVYEEADVVALSSEYEGMPNCLIEAIGCGIPIVSYDCPIGPGEIVVDGVNGYLVEYNNIEQLAECLIKALDKEWDAEKIKDTCSKFYVKNIAEQYLQVFQKVMAEE